MDHKLVDLQNDVNDAHDGYVVARDHVVAVCRPLFPDGDDAAAQLMQVAEEYGAGDAIGRLLDDDDRLAPVTATVARSALTHHADALEGALEGFLDARDRLDLAITKRETLIATGKTTYQRVVHIDGLEFVIDSARGELRAVRDESERYPLDLPGAPTLTEQLARDHHVQPAQPSPRPPGRTR